MAFSEERFPPNLTFHPIGGPNFQTTISVVESGFEFRNADWTQALRRYEVSHSALFPADYALLNKFFHTMQGRWGGFRFKDWTDFAATSSEGIFVLIDATHFQMYKRYSAGSINHDRIIQKPIATAAITGGTVSSIDYVTGIVTMTSGTPTAWAGQFDVPCRFDMDSMKGEIKDKSGREFVTGWDSIALIEIRLS